MDTQTKGLVLRIMHLSLLAGGCLLGSYFLHKIVTDGPTPTRFLMIGLNAYTVIASAVGLSHNE